MKKIILLNLFFLAGIQAEITFDDLKLKDPEFIEKIYAEYPDIKILCSKSEATPEGGLGTPKDCQPSVQKKACGQFFSEFDRTLNGVLALKWALTETENTKTNHYKSMSPEKYKEFHNTVDALVKSIDADKNKALDALIVFLIINDLGKVESLSEKVAKKAGKKIIDHDVVLLKVLEDKSLKPDIFSKLNAAFQQMIFDGLNTELNMQQFMQGENVPGSLSKYKDAKLDEKTQDLFALHALFDTAGAQGQTNCAEATIVTDGLFNSWQLALAALKSLNTKSEVEAYNDYLQAKARSWGLTIDVDDKKTGDRNKALIRLALLARTNNKKQFEEITDIFDLLPIKLRAFVMQQMTNSGIGDAATLIYYGPAIMTNAITKFGRNDGLKVGLRLLYRTYLAALQAANYPQKKGVYIANIRFVADNLKDQSLDVLNSMRITIRPEGDGGYAQWRMPTKTEWSKSKLAEAEDVPEVTEKP